MKRICFVLFFVFISINTVKADKWLNSFEDAKKLAIVSDKLVLVDFWANWCGPCKIMDSESWSKEEVKLLMDNYIPVKIDIDTNKSLAQKYGVKGIPYIFIMDGNGMVIYNEMSYKRKSQVIALLKKYALNTSFLRQDLINYHKQPNFSTSFRLASKYQDFSIYIEKDVRRDVLKLSNDYFNDAKKYLKDSNLKNKKAFLQKINLFSIQEKLILNKPNKAVKLLKKMNINEIDEINISFYAFLNYTAYQELNDEENSAIWQKQLKEREIKKSDLILKKIS